MEVQTLKLGLVTLIADRAPGSPYVSVTVHGLTYHHSAPVAMTIAEWSSLNAVNDALAASDVVHVRLRAALTEALAIAGQRFDPVQPTLDAERTKRLGELQDFLDGKRDGL